MKPTVGRIVHYVSYGTPGGEYGRECRAAVVTEVSGEHTASGGALTPKVSLCVLNPTGQFFSQGVPFHDGSDHAGAPDCPAADTHGNPFRYCSCGWHEAALLGGTWHWPART